MKEKIEKFFPKETIGWAILIFGGILMFFILNNYKEVLEWCGWFLSIFKPFIWGFVIAYFVNFFVRFFERKTKNKLTNPKRQRVCSMFFGYILATIIVTLCISIIVPQTLNSLSTLFDNTPTYIRNFIEWETDFAANYAWAKDISDGMATTLIDVANKLPTYITDYILPYTVDITTKITGAIINIFVAIVVSIYFLGAKERFFAQIKKMFYAHFKKDTVDKMIELTSLTNETFSNFISGKLIDSLIIGILAFIGLSIFNFPYAMLLAVIIGITNIIPFFGPFLGAIPSFFIILIVDPTKALWFLLFILILQQLDGNVIGPKILGYSIGISAIWIVFSIVVGNELLGFIGMVIGVPAFAVFYTLFKRWSERKLRDKGMPTETSDYASEENQIRF
ncbi:MAG: AI-2E family transporter [Firmicutes bacterium]|nr:AI-2E family transporter [Bacillota bacterium]